MDFGVGKDKSGIINIALIVNAVSLKSLLCMASIAAKSILGRVFRPSARPGGALVRRNMAEMFKDMVSYVVGWNRISR